jgi:aminoglycoside phosphotransferase (APT) family kinase protein
MADLLRPFGLVVCDYSLLAEGKVNTNYRVETVSGSFVLRLHNGADHVVDIEAALAERLSQTLPVPRLVGRGRRYLVYEFRSGISLEKAVIQGRDLPYIKVARELAAFRQALSGHHFPSAGFFGSDVSVQHPWTSSIDGLWSYLRTQLQKANLSPSLRERLSMVAEDAEPRLHAIAGPPVLVHGDFKASNVLVDETGLTAVLDWEFAHSGTWMTDVGQILRHEESLPMGFADAFTEVLGMDEEARVLVRTLDLVNLVDFLSPERDQPKMRAGVTRRIEEVCALYQARFGPLP